MKILRVFDSLKFLRTIFVAVACAFFIFPAHAELQDTELPVGYKRLTDVVFDGNTYYETNQRLYGTDTLTVRLSNTKTAGQNVIGAYSGTGDSARNFSLYIYGNGSSSDAYLRHGTILSRPNYGTGARTLVIGPTGTTGFAENTTYSAETFETTDTFWIGGLPHSSSPKYTGNIVGNITVGDRLKYIPCERTSDGAIGYYETVNKVFLENQGSGTPTTSGYDDSHMVEVPIKIATTKYNEQQFAPVEADLNAARTTINNLITQMQTNAVNVSKLAVEKQTRPNATCPAGKNCLLVMDPTGVENWYVIAGAGDVETAPTTPDYFSFTVDPYAASYYGDNNEMIEDIQFAFAMTPSGTFTIDWGDGSEPQVVNRPTVTNLSDSASRYSHSYTTGGNKTIKITGRATGYSSSESVIFFDDYETGNEGVSFVMAIDGSLGAIFPTLGNGAGQQPIFSSLFNNSKITSIPENLFRGVTGTANHMFDDVFRATAITSIPENLFSGVSGAADGMFNNTFAETPITSIPENLFRGVTGAAVGMFSDTFNSTQITSIPENLFRGVTGAAVGMFAGTFQNTAIKSIPENLFSGVTGAAESMFEGTFAYCYDMQDLYVPESTFAGLIANNSPDATNFMRNIFAGSGYTVSCNDDNNEVSTPYSAKYWSTGNGNAVMCRTNN